MKVTFRYGKADRASWVITLVVLAAMGGAIALLFATAGGAYYVAAWVAALCVAVVVLFLLSKPTRIILDDRTLELRCLVDTTYTPVESIVDIVSLGKEGFGRKVPVAGSYGFWGYFGRYADLKSRRIYRIYATTRKSCVAIHTTHHRYLVSCRNADLLVSLVLDARARSAKE